MQLSALAVTASGALSHLASGSFAGHGLPVLNVCSISKALLTLSGLVAELAAWYTLT